MKKLSSIAQRVKALKINVPADTIASSIGIGVSYVAYLKFKKDNNRVGAVVSLIGIGIGSIILGNSVNNMFIPDEIEEVVEEE